MVSPGQRIGDLLLPIVGTKAFPTVTGRVCVVLQRVTSSVIVTLSVPCPPGPHFTAIELPVSVDVRLPPAPDALHRAVHRAARAAGRNAAGARGTGGEPRDRHQRRLGRQAPRGGSRVGGRRGRGRLHGG